MAKSKLGRLARRPDIVATARSIFHDRGYAETSVQEIAEAVGLLKGSLYHYIASKDDLLFVIINEVHADMTLRWTESDPGGRAVARVAAFVTAHVEFTLDNQESVAVYLREFRSLDDVRRADVLVRRNSYERTFRTLLEAAQADGDLDPLVNPGFAARAVLGMVNWTTQWHRTGSAQLARSTAEQVATIALASLGSGAEPTHRSR